MADEWLRERIVRALANVEGTFKRGDAADAVIAAITSYCPQCGSDHPATRYDACSPYKGHTPHAWHALLSGVPRVQPSGVGH